MIRGRERLLMVHFDPPTNPMLPVPPCECAARVEGVPCPQWQIGLNTILAAEPVVCDLWWGKGQAALTLAPHQVTGSSRRGREAERLFVRDNTSIHRPNFIICMEMNSFSNWIFVFTNDLQSQLQPSIMPDTGNGCQKRVQWLRDPH